MLKSVQNVHHLIVASRLPSLPSGESSFWFFSSKTRSLKFRHSFTPSSVALGGRKALTWTQLATTVRCASSRNLPRRSVVSKVQKGQPLHLNLAFAANNPKTFRQFQKCMALITWHNLYNKNLRIPTRPPEKVWGVWSHRTFRNPNPRPTEPPNKHARFGRNRVPQALKHTPSDHGWGARFSESRVASTESRLDASTEVSPHLHRLFPTLGDFLQLGS